MSDANVLSLAIAGFVILDLVLWMLLMRRVVATERVVKTCFRYMIDNMEVGGVDLPPEVAEFTNIAPKTGAHRG